MKKMLTLVLALALTICLAAGAMAEYPKMELGIASTFVDPASDPAFNAEGLSLQYFIDLVNERSGGQITIKSYWSGMLQGDYPTMLSDGDLDLYYGYLNAAVDKRFSAFNLPGLVTDIDMGWALMGTDGEFYAKYKETLLSTASPAWRVPPASCAACTTASAKSRSRATSRT